jgi:hypothetical protein
MQRLHRLIRSHSAHVDLCLGMEYHLRMDISTMSEFLLKLILRYPELFDESQVPCVFRTLWRLALEDQEPSEGV